MDEVHGGSKNVVGSGACYYAIGLKTGGGTGKQDGAKNVIITKYHLVLIHHLQNKVSCKRFHHIYPAEKTSSMIRHQQASEVNSSRGALAANCVSRLIIRVTNALSLRGMRGPSEDPQ